MSQMKLNKSLVKVVESWRKKINPINKMQYMKVQ